MREINNEFYDELYSDWLHRSDHPVALLRAKNEQTTPWISEQIRTCMGKNAKVLDVGCGAGFLANHLAAEGFETTGVDTSKSSLAIAGITGQAHYQQANAYALPFPNASFDVVCAMDILEHLDTPNLLIAEASRVLKRDGLFFFHTLNRNFLTYFLIVKGVKWFIRNTPSNMHVYSLFIRPDELEEIFEDYKLKPALWRGLVPKFCSSTLLKLLFTRQVPKDFSFRFSRFLGTGYCGIAVKQVRY